MKTILVDAVGAFIYEGEGIYEPLHTLLDTYQNRKIIVTNADYEADNKYGLNDMPYEVFTLKHNPDKPDPAYFKMLLESLNFKPDELIYFEHSPEAVKSAESVGITTYVYDGEKKDLVALKAFLDMNLGATISA
jgi:HAD superfamily hydrolase (TIGR01509 family)